MIKTENSDMPVLTLNLNRAWRGGRVGYCGGLENRFGFTADGGSNPSLSARARQSGRVAQACAGNAMMYYVRNNKTRICERSDKDWYLGSSGRSPVWDFLAQGLSGAPDDIRAANARGIAKMHLADLGRIERLDRGGFRFDCLVGRFHSRGGPSVFSPVLLV